jgi:hypothetical protein
MLESKKSVVFDVVNVEEEARAVLLKVDSEYHEVKEFCCTSYVCLLALSGLLLWLLSDCFALNSLARFTFPLLLASLPAILTPDRALQVSLHIAPVRILLVTCST